MTEIVLRYDDKKAIAILRAVRQIDDGAELVPVVHGRWINFSEKHALAEECSVCGGGVMWNIDGGLHRYNYCPNCGAKMDL